MKRGIAGLLISCLILQTPLGVLRAEEMNKEIVQTAVEEYSQSSDSKSVSGTLEVVLESVLGEIDYNRDFQVSLKKAGSSIVGEPETFQFSDSKGIGNVSFEELESGNYTVSITANGFEEYTQDIQINAFAKKQIYVLTGYSEGRHDEENAHSGAMKFGDVNGDSIIDASDMEQIIDAIESEGASANSSTDLNRDGKVDEADLKWFSQSYERENVTSSIMTTISKEAIEPQVDENTVIVGDANIESILGESGENVTFKPANEERISIENPVVLNFTLGGASDSSVEMDGLVIQSPNGEGHLEQGTIIITDEQGDEIQIPFGEDQTRAKISRAASVIINEDGSLEVDLGGQVAVKKISIKVTATSGTQLADISKVEFINGMENRIPAPEMNIPTELTVKGLNKELEISWKAEKNVTGYEVEVSSVVSGKEISEVHKTTANKLSVAQFNNTKLVNKQEYKVRVQSVNGNWRSGYSESVVGIPMATEKPKAPDHVKAEGLYRSIKISWKDMEDTDSYQVFYREDGTEEYTKIDNIQGTSYVVSGLKDNTKYYAYVVGVNELGESPKSLESTATTTNINPVKMPERKLINTSNGVGQVSAHIENVTIGRGNMLESPLDDKNGKSGFGLVDNDHGSRLYVDDWDEGGAYPGGNKGVTVEFDQAYEMNYITLAEDMDRTNYSYVNVKYWDADGKEMETNASISKVKAENDRYYYAIKLPKKIQAKKIRIGVGRYGSVRGIYISELRFYHYDSLEDDIMSLYSDDMHTTLREDVTAATIEILQKRVDEKDEATGEYHPERELLQRELDTAKEILNNTSLNEVIAIHPEITAVKDGHLGFGGLNAWQPLGVTAYADEEIVVYVGHNELRTGANTSLKLMATQYHAEGSSFVQEVQTLKVGRNVVRIPKLQSIDVEKGGSLYVMYTGNNVNDKYGVRISGGTKVPMLDLYQVTDETERETRIKKYVQELNVHVKDMEKQHNKLHKGNEHKAVDYDYDKQNCILGTTDIMLDQMMYSISAEQVLNGIGKGTVEEQTKNLSQALKAMDEMMTLFYQHKGLSNAEGATAKDRLPSQHLNIRYHRMFGSAFMYAGGNHIGIEWGSIPIVGSARPVVRDENGKHISGQYFGWGIAHEIGHDINQAVYAIAEITNNYFSVLAQAKDTNDSVRFKYEDVYEKVTSNTLGKSNDVFTQLGMYWQLHLAYDRGYNYKTYDTYREQFDNLFFARVDTYARNTARAPKPNGIALTLSGNTDQDFMRLSTAAAEKNILEFFERWGMVPDEETVAYASQFEQETRAIYYVNDDARVYEIENGTADTVLGQDVVGDDVSAVVDETSQNQVEIALSNKAGNKDAVLGYEIARYSTSEGKESREVVGFTTEDKFVDTVTTINNRVFTYEITVIDKFLNRSVAKRLPAVKISHDGSYAKDEWTITTNMVSDQDELPEADENEPCAPELESAISKIADNKKDTTYTGKTVKSEDGIATAPEIVLNFNKTLEVTALKYTLQEGTAISDYEIQISTDGETWKTVKSDRFDLKDKTVTVYFENKENGESPFIFTYDARYVKLIATGQEEKEISISEIDVLGPTGDNVEFKKTDGNEAGVGRLKEDFVYDKAQQLKIEKDSLVFVGEYKGNPAYNVVVLYNEKGEIVGGVDADGSINANQIIMADVPEHGELGETSDGTFIYWVEPEQVESLLKNNKVVRAELYRVDNALTNEGQRLVSDTLPIEIPKELKEITLTGGKNSR